MVKSERFKRVLQSRLLRLSQVRRIRSLFQVLPLFTQTYVRAVEDPAFWFHTAKSLDSEGFTARNLRVLKNPSDIFDALRQRLKEAQTSVAIEIYWIDEDRVGKTIEELLLACLARGVRVRLLYDAVGSLQTSEEFFERLKRAGAEVRVFHPLRWWPFGEYQERLHRKSFLIDGRRMILGSFNLSEELLTPPVWKECAVDLELESPEGSADTEEPHDFRVSFEETWREAEMQEERRRRLRWEGQAISLGHRVERAREFFCVATDPRDAIFYRLFLSAIQNAKRRVWIECAYFAPPKAMVELLCRRAAEGIDVRVILPKEGDSGGRLAIWASRSLYTTLLRAGVHVFLVKDGVLHSKNYLVDETWSSLGSCNLDSRSIYYNYELNLLSSTRALSGELEERMRSFMTEGNRLTVSAWRRRSLGDLGSSLVGALIYRWV